MTESISSAIAIVAHVTLLVLAWRYYTGRVISVKDEILSYTTLSCSAETCDDAAKLFLGLEPRSAEKSPTLKKPLWVIISDRRVRDVPYWIQQRVGLDKYVSTFTGREQVGDTRTFIVITCGTRRAQKYLLRNLREVNLVAVGS